MNNEGSPASDLTVTLSAISTELLRAELRTRQDDNSEHVRPVCGSGAKGVYNTPLHVFALFLILVLSVAACAFPVIVRRFPSLPVPHRFLFLSRHFGTGVLIATAFCHLLPTAFTSLTDPCLPPFWSERYTAMPGLIAMMSVFTVIGIEMFFATRGAGHSHDYELNIDTEAHPTKKPRGNGRIRPTAALKRYRTGSFGSQSAKSDVASLISPSRPVAQRFNSSYTSTSAEGSKHLLKSAQEPGMMADRTDENEEADDQDSDLDLDELGSEDDPLTPIKHHKPRPQATHPRRNDSSHSHPDPPHFALPSTNNNNPTDHPNTHDEQKQILQVMLLEAGILFHSIFIGMALSVATGTSFIVLLVAISFHQTFEGLALGSRIASIRAFHSTSSSSSKSKKSIKPWLMALAYGTTTPLGQAIGLGVHNLYDPESAAGLLMVGVTNAISSGLLLFAGLVELLAEDFLSDKSYEVLTGRRRLEACGAVVAGGLLMALVGAWA